MAVTGPEDTLRDLVVQSEGLLDATEVAELLRLRPRSVRSLSRRGVLPPPLRIGRRLRWRITDIRAFITRS